MSWPSSPVTDHSQILAAAIGDIGGEARPGQQAMADAVASAFQDEAHLLVQAGTGTGKSLGYLAPALARCVDTDEVVIVATATLALQAQLATKDIPTALDAVEEVTGNRPKAAILKGRTNYACLYRARAGGDAEQDSLIGSSALAEAASRARTDDVSRLGAEVLALREWVEEEATRGGLADRDDAPTHTARGWQQVSIPTRECLGVAACPFGAECFVEASREVAREADLVVTNHALLAINAMHGGTALPEHGALIVDEAHELVSRITTAATDELTPGIIERAARRALNWLDDDLGVDFLDQADAFREALDESELTRITASSAPLVYAAAALRDVSRKVASTLSKVPDDPEAQQATAAVREVFDVADRIAALKDVDVVWVSESEIMGRTAYVAPLNVAGLLREQVFGQGPTVLTSATLTLGGAFEPAAGAVGLRAADRIGLDDEPEDQFAWRGLDVGSPFDYRRQGILYVARRLPPPGRDGMHENTLAEIAQLVWAAEGRALGLFASRRAAEQAAEYCRRELPELTVLCQGDAQLSELTRRFLEEPTTALFGTMSLWQGVDVPGEACQVVIIDKIPFPRPDDPLMQARKKAVDDAGGNGFMSVAAAHAALLLAQGAGRLIRRSEDKGVVAMLDPRLATARYGSFLTASLPDFWTTTDSDVAVSALRRLRGEDA
ncbi:ATP-dependent DNA helicase [Tessaracoccus massiliensis]|uniref:ATP-dependent DNA helicase n=1 Tax=Tessaracoccus massiliensis TaxID=1522311 RepID=UPI0006938A4A|nr:ATP-dependent DNA helicase [Tessaracoccus massiliensis]